MPAIEPDIDCGLTVHEIIARHPSTAAVFNLFGMDTCCGASATLEEAAHRDGVDTARLCAELRAAVRAT